MPAGSTLSCDEHAPCEVVVHPLVGVADVSGVRVGGRKNVFDAFPGGVLGSASMEITALTDFDCILASYPDDYGLPETTTNAKLHMLGRGTARREVREILGENSMARFIRCGETINRPGGWSSWPPHQFDKDGADGFQEVFCVFTDPRDGYAIIRKNGVLEELHSGDLIEVPIGSHPIVAGPGTRLMYVWVFVGAEKLYPRWSEDLGAYK